MKLYLFLFVMLLFVGFSSALGVSPAVDQTMIVYYHMNNNTVGENDTFIADSSPTSSNATTVGNPLFLPGTGILLNGSFSFNGTTNQRATSPDKGIWNLTNSTGGGLTVMAWINTSTLAGSGNGDIVTRYAAQNGNRSWALAINGNKTIFTGSGDGITVVTETGNTVIGSNSGLYHIAGVWNGTGLLVYVNGAVDGGAPSALGSIVSSSGIPIEIGMNRRIAQYNGTVDEVIVYNRSLSADEINLIYQKYNRTECGSTPTSNCIITQSSNFNAGQQFNITDRMEFLISNVTVNCQAATINQYSETTKYRHMFYASNLVNLTIKNCLLNSLNNTMNWSDAIRFEGINNSFIFNNTIYTSANHSHSIKIRDTSNNNEIYNNTLNTNGSDTTNIAVIAFSSNNRIYTNTITSLNSTISDVNYGIWVENGSINNITSNTINTYGATFSHGITVELNSGRNIVRDNLINTYGTNSHGLRVWTTAFNNTFFNNTVVTYGSGGNGIRVDLAGAYNNITGNRLTTNHATSAHGIRVIQTEVINYINFNTINVGGGTSSYGAYLQNNVSALSFSTNTYNTTIESVYADNGASSFMANLTFINEVFTRSPISNYRLRGSSNINVSKSITIVNGSLTSSSSLTNDGGIFYVPNLDSFYVT